MHFFLWIVDGLFVRVCVDRERDPGGEIWGVGNGCVFAAVADTDTSVYPAPNDDDDDDDDDDDSNPSDPSTALHTTNTNLVEPQHIDNSPPSPPLSQPTHIV
jgi:hypothetical protein